MVLLGNNFVVRNAYKLVNETMTALHNNLGVSYECIQGSAFGFISVISYPYIESIFKILAPPPVSTATIATATVTDQAAAHGMIYPDMKNVAIPSVISLFFDDHFVCGNMIGIGLAITPHHYLIGPLVFGAGTMCEWYFE